ncbi:uncharacterized protein KD926_011624 [Aspergillus affinis]|uniref:uncharacterized protein n=1 Tax=Aspergillus affinis TaxID=1070780 RepID=UPI0022FE2636|nr:uncharacterized protein KD926_011624 [Aspergillus affinis]KAI9044654.1 hypothetical protein KD926_011624 [Aspergillus affinis]
MGKENLPHNHQNDRYWKSGSENGRVSRTISLPATLSSSDAARCPRRKDCPVSRSLPRPQHRSDCPSCNVETMTTMVHELAFMGKGRTISFVRVPGHDHAALGYALDVRASVIVPRVNTVADAKHIVASTKYGARCGGTRSAPPYRQVQGITDTPIDPSKSVHENQNDQAAVVIQIKSLEGLSNLDAILTDVPEIDAVWLGTIDCRVSMGLRWEAGVVPTEPEWQDTLAQFKAIMKKHYKPAGGFALGPPEKMRGMGEGKALIFCAVDVTALLTVVYELKKARQVFALSN